MGEEKRREGRGGNGKLASKFIQMITRWLFGLGITHNGTVAISDTETGRSILAHPGSAKSHN
jgi:hypothetical protein